MKQFLASILFLSLILFNSCKKEQSTEVKSSIIEIDSVAIPSNYRVVLEGYAGGAKARIVVYAETEFKTGPLKLYTVIYDSITNKILNNGKLKVYSLLEDDSIFQDWIRYNADGPDVETTNDGIYKSTAYFHFPTTKKSNWWLQVYYTNNKGNISGFVEKNIVVDSPIPANVFPYVITNDWNDIYFHNFYLLTQPNWKEGLNDFELKVDQLESNTANFAPSKNFTMELEAMMPDSGLTSIENINPIHSGNGIYKGKINLTKKGLWHMKLKVFEKGVLKNDKVFFELIL
jgi:hypothetical protein